MITKDLLREAIRLQFGQQRKMLATHQEWQKLEDDLVQGVYNAVVRGIHEEDVKIGRKRKLTAIDILGVSPDWDGGQDRAGR